MLNEIMTAEDRAEAIELKKELKSIPAWAKLQIAAFQDGLVYGYAKAKLDMGKPSENNNEKTA